LTQIYNLILSIKYRKKKYCYGRQYHFIGLRSHFIKLTEEVNKYEVLDDNVGSDDRKCVVSKSGSIVTEL